MLSLCLDNVLAFPLNGTCFDHFLGFFLVVETVTLAGTSIPFSDMYVSLWLEEPSTIMFNTNVSLPFF